METVTHFVCMLTPPTHHTLASARGFDTDVTRACCNSTDCFAVRRVGCGVNAVTGGADGCLYLAVSFSFLRFRLLATWGHNATHATVMQRAPRATRVHTAYLVIA